jgi:hypothetical protein
MFKFHHKNVTKKKTLYIIIADRLLKYDAKVKMCGNKSKNSNYNNMADKSRLNPVNVS